MLTVKQEGKRVVNPDLTTSQTEDFNRDSIFKILVVECGFQATNRKDVWTHTQDDLFSVQLDTRNNRFLFEYKYKSDSHAFPSDTTNLDFISRFLETSREFFGRVKNPSE
jgi:hypothetical protein